MVEAGRFYLVQWSIPADEGARREKDKIKNAEPKDGPVVGGDNEQRQTADNVHEKDADVEHPQIIRHLEKTGEKAYLGSYPFPVSALIPNKTNSQNQTTQPSNYLLRIEKATYLDYPLKFDGNVHLKILG